jgi:quinol monooxygenase YgiN
MPHVTHFRFKAKPGERDAVIDVFQRWDQERRPKATGFLGVVLTSSLSDPDEFMASATFDTTEHYNANSNHPETNAWFERLRSHLVADPIWFDGTVAFQSSV